MRLKGTLICLCACAVLGGCASSPYDGRLQAAAPKPVSAVYSHLNMKLRLFATPNAPNRIAEIECSEFDCLERRIARVGRRLADAALQLYPQLACELESFEFEIVDKAEPGTMSTALGRIVIQRPVEALARNDAALGFIVAREMGHVIAQHHEENTAFGLIIGGLAQLLIPVTAVARVFSDMLFPGAATISASATVAANASVKATSYMGSETVVSVASKTQQDEADEIAMRLLVHLGYDSTLVLAAFAAVDLKTPPESWTKGLQNSLGRIARTPEEAPKFIQTAAAESPEPAAASCPP